MKKEQFLNRECLNADEAAMYLAMSKEWLCLQRKLGSGPAFCKLGSAKNTPVRYLKQDPDACLQAAKIQVA